MQYNVLYAAPPPDNITAILAAAMSILGVVLNVGVLGVLVGPYIAKFKSKVKEQTSEMVKLEQL